MFRSVIGSVSPRSRPMTGLKKDGRALASAASLASDALCAGEAREPAHALLRPHQRRVAQRFGAAGQDQIGAALADIAVAGVDRLHAGAAIDLHGEGHHLLAHAEPQGGDAGRIHLVGNDVDAAEDDLVERMPARRAAAPAAAGRTARRDRPA